MVLLCFSILMRRVIPAYIVVRYFGLVFSEGKTLFWLRTKNRRSRQCKLLEIFTLLSLKLLVCLIKASSFFFFSGEFDYLLII